MPLFVRRPPQPKPEIHDFLGKGERIVTPLTAPLATKPQPNRPPAQNPLAQSPLQQHLPQHRQQQRFPQRLPQPQQPHHAPQQQTPLSSGMHGRTVLPQQNDEPTPENAADHFRRVNKSLPDGVMYEPLDKDILRLLKENAQAAAAPAPVAPPPQTTSEPSVSPPPAPSTIPAEIATILESLAQNERNAQIFYSHIAQTAPEEGQKKSLTVLAKGCEARLLNYTLMLNTSFSREFKPKETEINVKIAFTDAISLAITEENKALTTLSDLLDQVAETSLEKQILRLLNKKIIAQQTLLAL